MQKKFRLMIVNGVNGDVVKEKILTYDSFLPNDFVVEDVLSNVKEMTTWFDDKETFFTPKKIWDNFLFWGKEKKFINVANGRRYCAEESIVVFPPDGGRGIEYLICIENINFK